MNRFVPATALDLADAASSPALDFIYQRLNYERVSHDSYTVEDFKLDRMSQLLSAIGNPQLELPCVHIAGTKGKGSTAAMLAMMLQAAHVRTGLYTSPHVHTYEERMTVNSRPPSPSELARLVSRIRPAVEALDRQGPEVAPTFFELTTALGWLFFQEAGAELVVLETGLGGRLDSTNVCRPLCCIITSISRDHTRLLGETLPEIAAEKAGILKHGVPVLSGVNDMEPQNIIRAAAQRCDSPFYCLDQDVQLCGIARDSAPGPAALPNYSAEFSTPWKRHPRRTAPLPGLHQIRNLALATAAFDFLSANWRTLDPQAIDEGLASLDWPLRIEQISAHPRVIVDAAHNDASIAALCETLSQLPHRRRILIFGTSRDKDVPAMLRIVADQFDEIVLTRYTGNPRSLPVDQLQQLAGETCSRSFLAAPDSLSAWHTARALATDDDLICITGSLFLAAEMRSFLRDPGL